MTGAPHSRVAGNALAIYGRSLAGGLLAFFANRWLLNGLGASDYGLFAVVGGLMAFLTFLNGAMTSAAQRHLAFAIGQGRQEETRRMFNAPLCVHLGLALLILAAGEVAGTWFVAHVLNVPDGRRRAAGIVFQCALASTMGTVLSVPFLAMFNARQRIGELALFGVAQSLGFFVLAFAVTRARGDRLVLYAAGYAAVVLAVYAAQVARAFRVFAECRVDRGFWRDRGRVAELVAYSGWNFLGYLSGACRTQGLAVLMNVLFGPVVNAAQNVANQVAGQVAQFGSGFLQAVGPEITTRQGAGQSDRMRDLAIRTCRYATLMGAVLMVPVAFELDALLRLWLRQVPPFTEAFCVLVFLVFSIDGLTVGFNAAVQAVGRIALFQITLGLGMIVSLPLAWAALKLTGRPTSGYWVMAGMGGLLSAGRIYWAWRLAGVAPARWLREVLRPVVLSLLPAVLAGWCVTHLLTASLARVPVTLAVTGALLAAGVWRLGLSADERAALKGRLACR